MIIAWMGVLSAIAVGFVVFPLMRRALAAPIAVNATPAVLVDQLNEVQRDLDRNLISEAEASAARLEIKRRILAVARRPSAADTAGNGGGRGVLWMAGLFVPVLAVGYYMLMGSPEISSLAYADRQAERAERQKIVDLTEKLYARLMSEPNGGARKAGSCWGRPTFAWGNTGRPLTPTRL